jgi:hypothetical protein
MQPAPLAALDEWRRQQEDLPGRAEAMRRLFETHPEIRRIEADQASAKLRRGNR